MHCSRPTASVTFLDFEYAGWDDPAKLDLRFLLPAGGASAGAVASSRSPARSRHASPNPSWCSPALGCCCLVYRVKWVCILLNEFLPVASGRRRFSLGRGTRRPQSSATRSRPRDARRDPRLREGLRMKVVVLGANSFSGQDFVDLLLDDPTYQVIGVSRSTERSGLFLKYRTRSDLSRYRYHRARHESRRGRSARAARSREARRDRELRRAERGGPELGPPRALVPDEHGRPGAAREPPAEAEVPQAVRSHLVAGGVWHLRRPRDRGRARSTRARPTRRRRPRPTSC